MNRTAGFLISSTLAAGLLCARILYVGRLEFLFLIWNLGLAWIPYVLGSILIRRIPSAVTGLLLAVWLLFFPNAPYVLTDLLHLHARPPIPEWFDLLMLLSFAWTALMLGFASLADVQGWITRTWGRAAGWTAAATAIVAASFAIYLGRFLRWNSWDLVTRPGGLFRDIGHRLIYPELHPRTVGMTLIFAAFLIVAYLMVPREIARPSTR